MSEKLKWANEFIEENRRRLGMLPYYGEDEPTPIEYTMYELALAIVNDEQGETHER